MPENTICREQILSENYRDFIVEGILSNFLADLSPEEYCTQEADFFYKCLYLPARIADPLTLGRYSYNTIPKCYAPLSLETLNQIGVLPVQNFPSLQLRGNDILIGFLDSGIDYTLPIFRNLDGTSRIAGIWDQTIQDGPTPELFSYGSVYTKEQLDAALQTEDPLSLVPSTDTDGHGTFVASLAAGGGNPEQDFLGAAPESLIAMVKLKQAKQYLRDYYFIPENVVCYQETDLLLGLRYLTNLAIRLSLPLVVCITIGTSSGGHLASLPLSNIIDAYAARANFIPVIGVGNEADKRHHYQSSLQNLSDSRTVEIRIGEGTQGFTMELWTSIPNIVTVSIESPGGESTSVIPIRIQESVTYSFLLERTRVTISYRLVIKKTNSELIFFRFQAPSPGIWKVRVVPTRTLDGLFHMWLPLSEFLSGEVFFLESNPFYTITNPGNTLRPLIMAYYDGSNNALALSSGRGYEIAGNYHPDLAAPGINVRGALPGGRFETRSGSCVSTAVSAGAAALLLEWVRNYGGYADGIPAADAYLIKSLFILGAVRPVNMSFPNPEWGYGQLNLFQVFEELRKL